MVETVDLVHEEDVPLFEIGEDGREVPRARDGWARGGLEARAHLGGDDAGERGLAQARRTREEHVIQRLIALPGGSDEHAQVGSDALLADVAIERGGPQAVLDVDVVRRELAGDHALALVGRGPHGIRKEVVIGGLPHQAPPPRRLSA